MWLMPKVQNLPVVVAASGPLYVMLAVIGSSSTHTIYCRSIGPGYALPCELSNGYI